MSQIRNLLHLKTGTQFQSSSAPITSEELSPTGRPEGMSPPWNSPPLNPRLPKISPSFISAHQNPLHHRQSRFFFLFSFFFFCLWGCHQWMLSAKCWHDEADQGGASQKVSSAKRPHLQLHDSEVVGVRQTAVVEGKAGAAAAQVQVLIHPQTEVTTAAGKRERATSFTFYFLFPNKIKLHAKDEIKSLPASTNGKGVQVSFDKKGVLSSPSEALQRKRAKTITIFSSISFIPYLHPSDSFTAESI